MNNFFKIILVVILIGLCNQNSFAIIQDDFVDKTLLDTQKPLTNRVYNYESTAYVPIKLKITSDIKSEKNLFEGQIIEFRTVRPVYCNHKILLDKNEIITAKVETIIKNGMNGIPASVILGDFQVPNVKPAQISQSYEKFGLDLSLIVYPIKWALTPLPPTGSLTNFIKGGHVKIKDSDTITIYYHPDWM